MIGTLGAAGYSEKEKEAIVLARASSTHAMARSRFTRSCLPLGAALFSTALGIDDDTHERMLPDASSVESSKTILDNVERKKNVFDGKGDEQAVYLPEVAEENEEMFEVPGAANQTDEDVLSTAKKPARNPAAQAA